MRTITGDLLEYFDEGMFDYIAHGCNCQAVMGAGIARQIAMKYPQAAKADLILHESVGPQRLLGNYSVAGVVTQNGMATILNLYTQFNPGRDASLDAVKSAFKGIAACFGDFERSTSIGIPLIGCGIGGLKWEDVEALVKIELDPFFDVTIVKYGEREIEKEERSREASWIDKVFRKVREWFQGETLSLT